MPCRSGWYRKKANPCFPPENLAFCTAKMKLCSDQYLFNWVIFRFQNVNFQGCNPPSLNKFGDIWFLFAVNLFVKHVKVRSFQNPTKSILPKKISTKHSPCPFFFPRCVFHQLRPMIEVLRRRRTLWCDPGTGEVTGFETRIFLWSQCVYGALWTHGIFYILRRDPWDDSSIYLTHTETKRKS